MFGMYRNMIKGPIFVARTMIYAKMTQDGMRLGRASLRKEKVLKLYDEVVQEITNL